MQMGRREILIVLHALDYGIVAQYSHDRIGLGRRRNCKFSFLTSILGAGICFRVGAPLLRRELRLDKDSKQP